MTNMFLVALAAVVVMMHPFAATTFVAAVAVSACDAPAPDPYTGLTQVLAWGSNAVGQLGSSIQTTVHTPRPVTFTREMKITKLSGNFMTVAALDADSNTAWLAGEGSFGQLGAGPSLTSSQRQFLPFPFIVDEVSGVPTGMTRKVIDVSCGFRHTCAVVESKTQTGVGVVFCTGANYQRQLGTAAFDKISYLVSVKNVLDPSFAQQSFTEVYAGGEHTVALTTTGTLWSWGSNQYGQLGDGSTTGNFAEPRLVAISEPVVKACCGFHYCLALVRRNRTLFGWGANQQFQLGRTDAASFSRPVEIVGLVEQFSCGQTHALAVVNGVLYSWGEGTMGATGQRRTISEFALDAWYVRTPQPVPDLQTVAVASVSAGAKHSVVLDTCGRVFTLGADNFGQLGLGYLTGASQLFRSLDAVGNAAIQRRGATAVSAFATGFSSFLIVQQKSS